MKLHKVFAVKKYPLYLRYFASKSVGWFKDQHTKIKILNIVAKNAKHSLVQALLWQLANKNAEIKLKNGITCSVRNRAITDQSILYEVFIKKVYDIEKEIPPDGIIIDIGGHIGASAIFFSRKVPKGKVYVFEPVKENYNKLNKNLEKNQSENVIAENRAVTKESGSRKIHISVKNTGGHSLFSKGETTMDVQGTTIQDIIKKEKITKINVLKLDCEGAEYEILESIGEKEFKIIENIVLEYHTMQQYPSITKKPEWIIKHLEKNGFIVRRLRESQVLHATRG